MWSAGPAPEPPGGARSGALDVRLGLQSGMRVGLFGGSFDPAHEGHAHVAETALRRLGLDRVIWLVSPGNPLKPRAPAGLARRMASARARARGPRMMVSDAESKLGVRYTIDTVRALRARYPGVRFVWIMGADSLGDLHRWRGWTQLMTEIPMAIVARPGSAIRSRLAPAARRYAHARLPSGAARLLAGSAPPAWTFLEAPWNYASSTALRSDPAGAAH